MAPRRPGARLPAAMLRAMRQNPLGRSELTVSAVGLGCNNFGRRLDKAGTRAVIAAALDHGITFLDTADIYGGAGASEQLIGELLEGRRDSVVLATKFGMDMGEDGDVPRGSRTYARRAVEASLRRLRTDVIDLYYLHEPDGVTPLAESIGALAELADEGKIRTFGVSNLDAAQLREAVAAGDDRLVALQNEYNLLEREDDAEVLPYAREHGVGYVPFFPLASGVLTGKFRRGEAPPEGTRMAARADRLTDALFDRVEALEAFAGERGHTLLELAFAGLASQPGIPSVIAGAMRPEQVAANVAAAEWELSDADLRALAEV
jgi:aryl-alcohol dehydrogenase-like predicted oxidoreductase